MALTFQTMRCLPVRLLDKSCHNSREVRITSLDLLFPFLRQSEANLTLRVRYSERVERGITDRPCHTLESFVLNDVSHIVAITLDEEIRKILSAERSCPISATEPLNEVKCKLMVKIQKIEQST